MNQDVMLMQFKIIKISFFGFLLACAGAFFIAKEPLAAIYGLTFGWLISILNFRSMAISLEKAVQMNPGSAQVYIMAMYILRMLIYGVVIYVSIQADYINVLGTILGLLLIKIAIHYENLLKIYKK